MARVPWCAALVVVAATSLASTDLVRDGEVEFHVNTHTANAQASPEVALGGTGEFVVVWQSYLQDGSSWGVFGQRFDSSAAFVGAEFWANSGAPDGPQRATSVARDATGNFVVVWQGKVGLTDEIFARMYDSNGVPLSPVFRVNTFTQNNQSKPAVAMDATGNFVVVWESFGADGSYLGVSAQRYDSSGAVQGGEFQVNEYTTYEQSAPRIAMTGTGEFVVVWQSYGQDGSAYGVFGRRYDPSGTSSGGEFQVNTLTDYSQGYAQVDMDPAGGFVVAWDGPAANGVGYDVFAQRYDSAGLELGSEILVNLDTPRNQLSPSVAASSDGFVVSWQSNRGATGFDVLAQAFATDGTRQGRTIVANAFQSDSQFLPSVSSNASGELVIAWTSEMQDGSGTGIYSQRFCTGPTVSGLDLRPVNSGATLHFTWNAPAGAGGYRIVEDDLPSGAFASVTGEVTGGATELMSPMPPGSKYYLVSGLGASCDALITGVPAGSVPDGNGVSGSPSP